MPPGLGTQSLNHWTTRGSLKSLFLLKQVTSLSLSGAFAIVFFVCVS